MPRRAQKVSDTVTDQFVHLVHRLRDEGHMFLLQRVPHYTPGLPATTCRHLQCPYKDAIFRGGDFILSLEKPERCDPWRNPLSYKAVACLSEVLRSGWNHNKGKRGLGEHGEERWHVTCFESLCREVRKRELLMDPGDEIPSWAPSMEFGQHIFTDERTIRGYPGKFNVESPYQFGLELWKATQLFDDRQAHGAHFQPNVPLHIRLPNKLIGGSDGQSLYLTDAAKNFRGKMPWGEFAEITAADVRGVTLDEMTRRVSAIVTPKYQARRALKKQEELAKKAGKESKELDEKRPGDGQSPKTAQDQPSSGLEHTESAQGRATSPINGVPAAFQSASLEKPAPAEPEPSQISQKHNQQGDLVAQRAVTAPEKEATGGDANVADEDSEDDVVFLGWKKTAKVANEHPEEPNGGKATSAREARRSPRGGRGRWRYTYAN